jgi:hypothetical protein
MVMLSQGAGGAAVVDLQNQLIQLGFLPGAADGSFGPGTAQAVRDLQRRLLLRPDGVVGPLTAAALAAAIAASPPAPTSPYRALRREGADQEAQGQASDDHLPWLDRGIGSSPFRSQLPRYAERLASPPTSDQLRPYPDASGNFAAWPAHGVVPPIQGGRDGRGGLEFLSDAVSQACLCVGSGAADRPLRLRWYGRRALEDNVQFWSATKFVAALQLVCQANRRSPGTPIGLCQVRAGDGSAAAPFGQLVTDMVSYAKESQRSGSSNAIGYMLKLLRNPGEADVQTWLRALTGNPRLTLLGRYGFDPLFAAAELVGPAGPLVGHRPIAPTRNLVSAYDLVRVLAMLGWHHLLPADGRLPGAQWGSLATVVEGLGHDTARYLDGALERLGLLNAVAEPVILSKMGYGVETGDAGIDALSYAAFASFQDTRQSPRRQRSFAFALRIPTRPGRGVADDARMAAEVTEIVRRIFAEEIR